MIIEPQKVLHLHKELEKKKPKISGDYFISEKLDGWYIYVDYDSASEKFSVPMSSASRPIPAFEHTLEKWERLYKPNYDIRLIAEAYIPGVPFHVLNGVFNRSVGNYACEDVQFYLHDFIRNKKETAQERQKILTDYINYNTTNLRLDKSFNPLEIIKISSSIDEFQKEAEEIWNKGGEGVVLKKLDSLYLPGKRNSDLMKIKLEEEFDLFIVDIYKTIGEKGNEATNLTLRNKKGIEVSVVVPKHSDQEFINENLSVCLNSVATIKCMKQLEDGSYREPRFKCFRFDKKIQDID